jgi:hypothetical protein
LLPPEWVIGADPAEAPTKITVALATPEGSLIAADTPDEVGVQPFGALAKIGSGEADTFLMPGPSVSCGTGAGGLGVKVSLGD